MFSDAIILINSRPFINTSGLFALQYLRIEVLISLVIGQIRFFSPWIYIFKISLLKLLKELDDVNPPGRVSDTSRPAGLWGWMVFCISHIQNSLVRASPPGTFDRVPITEQGKRAWKKGTRIRHYACMHPY